MYPALASWPTTMYSDPWLNLMLRSSPCSRSVRLSSYGCMGCCDRYDITASASRLPTLRFLAISPSSPWGVPPGGGTPVVMGDQAVRAGSSTVGNPALRVRPPHSYG